MHLNLARGSSRREPERGPSQGKPHNIMLSGHCDHRGSTEYNLALGERALAVRQYLISMA